MSLYDCTLLQAASTQKNHAIRIAAMMQAQLHFLEPFLSEVLRLTLKAELRIVEEEIRNFDVKSRLHELEEIIPHKES